MFFNKFNKLVKSGFQFYSSMLSIDPYHSAAMLSLKRIKSLQGKPYTEFASGQGLPCKNKGFFSTTTWPPGDKGL